MQQHKLKHTDILLKQNMPSHDYIICTWQESKFGVKENQLETSSQNTASLFIYRLAGNWGKRAESDIQQKAWASIKLG